MTKARNGIRYTAPVKQQAKLLRADGMTHREIAKELNYRLIEVYPDDIYPKNKLLALLKDCR